jgi:hypothetical protein
MVFSAVEAYKITNDEKYADIVDILRPGFLATTFPT